MPRIKSMPRRRRGGARTGITGRKMLRKYGYNRPPRGIRSKIVTNTASTRENYSVSVNDGAMTFLSITLAQAGFNRSQQVAEVYQEYRVKYIKLIFRPSADTWPVGSGPIPQLYFQLNKYNAIATNATLQNLYDMGCRPIRFDDKNIVKAWKPVVLLGADGNNPTQLSTTAAVKVSPWLSTNGFAGLPNSWTLSDIEHLGCVFYVTKPSPTTPTIAFNVDVEVVFQFRRPVSNQANTGEPYSYQKIAGENVTMVDVSGNQV